MLARHSDRSPLPMILMVIVFACIAVLTLPGCTLADIQLAKREAAELEARIKYYEAMLPTPATQPSTQPATPQEQEAVDAAEDLKRNVIAPAKLKLEQLKQLLADMERRPPIDSEGNASVTGIGAMLAGLVAMVPGGQAIAPWIPTGLAAFAWLNERMKRSRQIEELVKSIHALGGPTSPDAKRKLLKIQSDDTIRAADAIRAKL